MKKCYFSPEFDFIQLKLESIMTDDGEQYIRPSLREDNHDDLGGDE